MLRQAIKPANESGKKDTEKQSQPDHRCPILLALICTNACKRNDPSAVEQKIDSLFQFYSSDKPGGQLTVAPPSGEPMGYHRVDIAKGVQLSDQYTGEYFSDEAGAAIEIRKVNGGLEARLISGTRHPLENYFKDGFRMPDIKTDLVFKRNGKNEVEAFELNTLRTRGLKFEKVKTKNSRGKI